MLMPTDAGLCDRHVIDRLLNVTQILAQYLDVEDTLKESINQPIP
jgi:hypothetical protein